MSIIWSNFDVVGLHNKSNIGNEVTGPQWECSNNCTNIPIQEDKQSS